MTEKNIPHQTIEKFIALENLYSLCLDDSWLIDRKSTRLNSSH